MWDGGDTTEDAGDWANSVGERLRWSYSCNSRSPSRMTSKKCKCKSNSNKKNKSNRRSPAGMTTKKQVQRQKRNDATEEMND